MDDEWRKNPAKRKRADRHLKVVQEQVQKRDKSIEELERENAQSEILEGGIPVMWGTEGLRQGRPHGDYPSELRPPSGFGAGVGVAAPGCRFGSPGSVWSIQR